MPELPEVEMIARKLRPHLAGRTFTEVVVLWERSVARPGAKAFCRALTGAQVQDVRRRGKYLLFPLDTGQTWLAHLRMTGQFLLRPAGEGDGADPHVRARFHLDDGTWLLFSDTRKFGRFYLVDDPQEVVGALGPEPLGAEFTAARLAERLAGRHGELKRLLLDQHFIAGLGNIYVSEALWRARIHPRRVAGTLTREEAGRLHAAIVGVLTEGIANGGTTLDDHQYVYPDGGLGRQQEHLAVYERAGERCPRCGAPVERIVQGQRSTYLCPVCQKLNE